MALNFSKIQTETIGADLSQVVDRIARQYGDFPHAFQKEAIQNAWDARLNRKFASSWIIKIASHKNNIVVEDFGTTGMDNSGWEAFTALWKPKKKHIDAGGQGQGKFVLMGASKKHILVVESKNKKFGYKCRFLQNDQKDAQKKKFVVGDFIKGATPLSHQGTKIWVCDVKKDFMENLTKKGFAQEIAATWWQILQKPFNSKIFFLERQVLLPRLPAIDREKIICERRQIGKLGRIKRLVLQLYEKDLPELFTGVRIQRAQMMVTRIPFEVHDDEYKDRLSGYILFDEDLESSLKKIEKTDHCGFIFESPWKEIKRLIEKEIEKFKEEVLPKKKKKSPITAKIHDEILDRVNQIIIDYIPELSRTSGSVMPQIEPKKPPKLRIDSLTVDKREKIKFEEPIQRRCTIKNETNKTEKVLLELILKHKGKRINEENFKFKMKSGERKTLILSVLSFDKNSSTGKYTIRGILKKNNNEVHTKATSFYLEAKRPRLKIGFIKKWKIEEFPDKTIRSSQIRNGSITINETHPDFENIWNSLKNHRLIRIQQIKFYIQKIILDEAIRELFKHQLREGESLTEEQMNEIIDLRDKIYYEVYV